MPGQEFANEWHEAVVEDLVEVGVPKEPDDGLHLLEVKNLIL